MTTRRGIAKIIHQTRSTHATSCGNITPAGSHHTSSSREVRLHCSEISSYPRARSCSVPSAHDAAPRSAAASLESTLSRGSPPELLCDSRAEGENTRRALHRSRRARPRRDGARGDVGHAMRARARGRRAPGHHAARDARGRRPPRARAMRARERRHVRGETQGRAREAVPRRQTATGAIVLLGDVLLDRGRGRRRGGDEAEDRGRDARVRGVRVYLRARDAVRRARRGLRVPAVPRAERSLLRVRPAEARRGGGGGGGEDERERRHERSRDRHGDRVRRPPRRGGRVRGRPRGRGEGGGARGGAPRRESPPRRRRRRRGLVPRVARGVHGVLAVAQQLDPRARGEPDSAEEPHAGVVAARRLRRRRARDGFVRRRVGARVPRESGVDVDVGEQRAVSHERADVLAVDANLQSVERREVRDEARVLVRRVVSGRRFHRVERTAGRAALDVLECDAFLVFLHREAVGEHGVCPRADAGVGVRRFIPGHDKRRVEAQVREDDPGRGDVDVRVSERVRGDFR
eukprot:18522-Pelagococcus_subviridis.AAC.21